MADDVRGMIIKAFGLDSPHGLELFELLEAREAAVRAEADRVRDEWMKNAYAVKRQIEEDFARRLGYGP